MDTFPPAMQREALAKFAAALGASENSLRSSAKAASLRASTSSGDTELAKALALTLKSLGVGRSQGIPNGFIMPLRAGR